MTTMGPFFYMILCVYWSLFNFKIDGFVGLSKGNTDGYSLLFFAQYF